MEANGVDVSSSGYYEQLSAAVAVAYPDKWRKYSAQGCMLNTMAKQQGIINSAVTVECALSNRAAWAESQLSSSVHANVHDKAAVRASWPRISPGRVALVDELAHSTASGVRQGTRAPPAHLPKAVPRTSTAQPVSKGVVL